jgi:hypothetical protein
MPFEHMLYFHTREQAEEATQLSFPCTNMVVTTSSEMIEPLVCRGFCGLPSILMGKRTTDEKPVLSFQTEHPLGPITQIALAHETHAIQVVANSPSDRTRSQSNAECIGTRNASFPLQYPLIDGLHRLYKAVRTGQLLLPCMYLSLEEARLCVRTW